MKPVNKNPNSRKEKTMENENFKLLATSEDTSFFTDGTIFYTDIRNSITGSTNKEQVKQKFIDGTPIEDWITWYE
jgi:uncharacterized FAD-dependent dehydrogenase